MAAVVARPNVQRPQRVPLGGLPAVWCSGARSRSLSTNTQVIWKMCSFVCPLPTLLSTNASCQPEKPENSQVETWGSAATRGVELAHPRCHSSNRRERGARKNPRNVADTDEGGAGAAVNKTAVLSWGKKVVAPLSQPSSKFLLFSTVASGPRGEVTKYHAVSPQKVTISFDRNHLQADVSSAQPRLPRLELSLQIGRASCRE